MTGPLARIAGGDNDADQRGGPGDYDFDDARRAYRPAARFGGGYGGGQMRYGVQPNPYLGGGQMRYGVQPNPYLGGGQMRAGGQPQAMRQMQQRAMMEMMQRLYARRGMGGQQMGFGSQRFPGVW